MDVRRFSRRSLLGAAAIGAASAALGGSSATAAQRSLALPASWMCTVQPVNSLQAAGLTPMRWSDPRAWANGRVPGAADVAHVTNAIVLDGEVRVAGVEVAEGATLTFDPARGGRLLSRGNVVIRGTLLMQPALPSVEHRIQFVDVVESRFVGGGMTIQSTDVGLWVTGQGVVNAVGSPTASWHRGGWHPSWTATDEVWLAPTAAGDYSTFNRFGPRSVLPAVPAGVPAPETFNTSRNVVIGGTPGGRAHVMFLHCARPQVLQNVRVEHVGPRRLNGTKTELVPGRYGVHFHHCGDGSRGSTVSGVVVTRCGTRAFVPHASHGISFTDCIAHDVAEDGFWWDPDKYGRPAVNATHDTLFQRCAAFLVAPPANGVLAQIGTGFHLGQGLRNRCLDSVAVGVTRGGVVTSGFLWPESANLLEASWEFRGNVAHNNQNFGARIWSNDPWGINKHLLADFVAYRNGAAGVDSGAYVNTWDYARLLLVENGSARTDSAGIVMHLGRNNRYDGLTVDAGGRSMNCLWIGKHQARSDSAQPVRINGASLRGQRGRAIKVLERRAEASSFPGHYDFVGVRVAGRDLQPSDFDVADMVSSSVYRVQRSDGSAFRLMPDGRGVPIAAFA